MKGTRAARFVLVLGIACGAVQTIWATPPSSVPAPDTAATAKPTKGRAITIDGTLIDGERITGALRIAARDVTVKNSWIISDFSDFGTGRALSGTGVITIEPGASATISHCTLDGSNATHAGIWHAGTSMAAIANNIFGVNDGIFSWSDRSSPTAGWNVLIQDNYLHDFTTLAANGHIDGYQTEGASHVVIRHNTFYITEGQNGAVAIWNSMRDSDDFLVDSNLVAGGGFAMYAEDYHPSERNPKGGYSVTNIIHTNNRFSTSLYPCAGAFGIWYPRGSPTDGWRRSGNKVLETGENVDFSNPHVNGQLCK